MNLDTESSIEQAESLADAIGELAGENPVTQSSNGSSYGTSSAHPFWTALHDKAERSAEYITTTKTAERLY